MTRLLPGLAAALFAAGCGRESDGAPKHTEEYKKFRAKQVQIRVLGGGPLRGTVIVHPPAPQTPAEDQFLEVYVNGQQICHFWRLAEAGPAQWDVKLKSGANRVSAWDSSLNRGFSETLDSRAGTAIEIAAGGLGWEIRARPE